jgi:DNA polymerase elongation subunit (family B)
MTLQSGQTITNQLFGVASVTQKKTAKGNPYLQVELTTKQGSIDGKVWEEQIPLVKLESGQVHAISGQVDSYRGTINFNIFTAKPQPEIAMEEYLPVTSTLVFDIETVGKPFETLDEAEQDYLLNNLEKKFEGTEEQKRDRTALYPLFAEVVAIGLYDVAAEQAEVYYIGQDLGKASQQFEAQAFTDEPSLIKAFWSKATNYDRFVTYNGSGFDFPFLAFRSAVHRLKVPFETKGSSEVFVDLAKKIRMNFRSFKLEMVCKALGINNPKEAGVSGMEVAKLYRAKKIAAIVEYVARDVESTNQLYEVWRKYMAGKIMV